MDKFIIILYLIFITISCVLKILDYTTIDFTIIKIYLSIFKLTGNIIDEEIITFPHIHNYKKGDIIRKVYYSNDDKYYYEYYVCVDNYGKLRSLTINEIKRLKKKYNLKIEGV